MKKYKMQEASRLPSQFKKNTFTYSYSDEVIYTRIEVLFPATYIVKNGMTYPFLTEKQKRRNR